jgi:zinc/manganese transport system substrate-binding protein
MARTLRNVAALWAGLLVLASPALAQAPERMKVVATFSILGDFVQQVGGERVEAVTLVGPDGDAHVYSPTPADGRRLSDAKVVFMNGMNFEGWIERLVKASGTKAALVEVSKGIKVIATRGHRHDKHGHGHAADPHTWHDVANAKAYVRNIRDALSSADPDGKAMYAANAEAYLEKLDTLQIEVKNAVERIPASSRKIITSHDAFAYFGNAYGIEFVAPQGVSTESEASAKDVARIIQQIKRERIKAIFVENISDPRLIQRIAQETGARIGERLYSDALSPPDGPAGTYIEMMRHNIRAISMALSS